MRMLPCLAISTFLIHTKGNYVNSNLNLLLESQVKEEKRKKILKIKLYYSL